MGDLRLVEKKILLPNVSLALFKLAKNYRVDTRGNVTKTNTKKCLMMLDANNLS